MPRTMSTAMLAQITATYMNPCLFAVIPWQGVTQYVWSGVGTITVSGHTYTGVGQFGTLSAVQEVAGVNATGVTLTLSGVDPTTIADAIDGVNQGNIAQIYLGAVVGGAVVATPVLVYQGLTDQVTIDVGSATATVTLSLESRLSDLQRPMVLKLTDQMQEQKWPGDVSLLAVTKLIDCQLFWGR